jgi:hypothetical protein
MVTPQLIEELYHTTVVLRLSETAVKGREID